MTQAPIPADALVFDWNTVEKTAPLATQAILLNDETLRDGIQSPSVIDPPIEDKLSLLRLMHRLGIHCVNIGLPGAGPRAVEDVVRLAKTISGESLALAPNCAARTHANDVNAIVECSQRSGSHIEVMAFLGSSPVRLYAENWDLPFMQKAVAESLDIARKNGLKASFVTEDTIRSRPEVLAALFKTAIQHGAHRFVLCDTVGHATPDGVRALARFAQNIIAAEGAQVELDWHGHNDRGLGLPNCLAAIDAGITRIHGAALGIGERVGNASMDQLIVNLRLLGAWTHEVSALREYCELASRACGVPIPVNYPVFGRDAFRTATGVHAAAIIKAEKKGDEYLSDVIYSGVPASVFGKRQEIEIGHMSGESNVVYWLSSRGISPEPALVKHLFQLAKRGDRTLEEDELRRAIADFQAPRVNS
jgi:2-isopropylmalate synthase